MTSVTGQKALDGIRSRIEGAERRFRAALGVVPEELAYTASETLPLLRRADLLNPVRPKPRIYVDAYYSDGHSAATPDVYILPLDAKTLCMLQPGRAVFLSDGSTHHYALIDNIDYGRRVVTLLDPWANVSFLLPGRNLLGIEAKARAGPSGQPLLDIGFDDFLSVLHGSIEEFLPEQTFTTLEALRPEFRNDEDYLVWKYSRLLSPDSFQMAFMQAFELSARADLGKMPKLEALSHWASDYLLGAPADFSGVGFGTAPRPGDGAAPKQAFIKRLDVYAKFLPWRLKWLLYTRVRDLSADTDLSATMLDVFLKQDPSDVDFQIARSETSIVRGRFGEAVKQLETAERQWRSDVARTIATSSPERSIALLFEKDYNLQSVAVLKWRHARIVLLSRVARLAAGIPVAEGHDAAMETLQAQYRSGSVLIDFLPEVMWAAALAHEPSATSDYVATASRLPYDLDRNNHLSEALYRHFASREPITTLSPKSRSALSLSRIGRQFCGIVKDDRVIPDMKPELVQGLKAFCDRLRRKET